MTGIVVRDRSARDVLVRLRRAGVRSCAPIWICARSISRARACRCSAICDAVLARPAARRRTAAAARRLHDACRSLKRRAGAPLPPGDRRGADGGVADGVSARRADRAAQDPTRRRRAFGRRRLGGDRLPVRARARSGERLRDSRCRTRRRARRAWPTRNWSSTRSGINVADDRDHRGGRRLSAVRTRRRRAPARQRDGAHAHDSCCSISRPSSTRCRSEPETRPNGLLGYFTWHADDTPPVNPLGDLFKTQVWALARYLGVPRSARSTKPPSADLEAEPNRRRRSRHHLRYAPTRFWRSCSLGYSDAQIVERGFDAARGRARARGASTARIGSAIFRRPRCSRTRRSTSSTCVRSTTRFAGVVRDLTAAVGEQVEMGERIMWIEKEGEGAAKAK